MTSLNDHILHLFFRLRWYYQVLKNRVVDRLGLNHIHNGITLAVITLFLKSFPFAPFAKIVRLVIMFFNFSFRLVKFLVFQTSFLFSFFTPLVAWRLLHLWFLLNKFLVLCTKQRLDVVDDNICDARHLIIQIWRTLIFRSKDLTIANRLFGLIWNRF